jgi:phosphopantothenoylcysteine synthetase/decarboxylase
MRLLVTAGNTQVPLDQVRCITNIFTGRTGARIALHAHERGHTVTLLTSHPDVVAEQPTERWAMRPYRTFEDLREAMSEVIRAEWPDVVIHSAAVSDYQAAGIFRPAEHTHFRIEDAHWESDVPELPALVDVGHAGKIKSDEPELWLRLVRTPKLIDLIRPEWGFQGVLVKFKLEVGISEERLRAIAEASRQHSAADLMVANTLEGAASWAYLGPLTGGYERLARRDLEARLLDAVEKLYQERSHG